MERLLRATVFGMSLFIAAGIVQVWRGDRQRVGVKGRAMLHSGSDREAVNGRTLSAIEMTTKRLAIFKKILHHSPRQILVLYSTPDDAAAITEARMAGEKLGIKVIAKRVQTVAQLNAELRQIKNGAVDGIFHIPDNWIDNHIELILQEAREKKIPTMTYAETYVALGALAAYKMRGSEAAAARYDLILNLDTARQIGMTFPARNRLNGRMRLLTGISQPEAGIITARRSAILVLIIVVFCVGAALSPGLHAGEQVQQESSRQILAAMWGIKKALPQSLPATRRGRAQPFTASTALWLWLKTCHLTSRNRG